MIAHISISLHEKTFNAIGEVRIGRLNSIGRISDDRIHFLLNVTSVSNMEPFLLSIPFLIVCGSKKFDNV